MNHDHDTRFDQAMRQLHAEALTQVTANTRARLRSARHAAAIQAPARRGVGWVLATGCAAVFALVIGLQLRGPTPGSPPAAPPATEALADTQTVASDYDDTVAVLEENPDLYLWLASNDEPMPPVSE